MNSFRLGLLFFGKVYTRIWYVGMYVSGRGKRRGVVRGSPSKISVILETLEILAFCLPLYMLSVWSVQPGLFISSYLPHSSVVYIYVGNNLSSFLWFLYSTYIYITLSCNGMKRFFFLFFPLSLLLFIQSCFFCFYLLFTLVPPYFTA